MGKKIFEEMQPGIIERLGEAYNRDPEYKRAVEEESKWYKKMQESLVGEEQMRFFNGLCAAISAKNGICEMLAYEQGMKDLAAMLGMNEQSLHL